MPEFPIVDAHVHFYDPGHLFYPWLQAIPQLNKPHLPGDFARATADVALEAMVFVEVDVATGAHLDEANWVARQADRDARLRGMVVSMPLETGVAVESNLAACAEIGLARGVRRLIQSHADQPGWCLQPEFVAGVRLLPKYGFSFDLCLLHHQLPDACELVRRCPEVRFVIDHMAKPGIRLGILEPWRAQMRAIARLPNVWCKISGVVTEADHRNWTEDEVVPYIAHAIDCFGFDRVMFGGDWPVCELAASYCRWVALLDRVVAGASDAERHKLYRDNAIGFYRL